MPTRIDQNVFRFRCDNGSEEINGATWKNDINQNVIIPVGEVFRLRIGANSSMGGTWTAGLICSINGTPFDQTPYPQVTPITSKIKLCANNSGITENSNLTQQITSGGTYVAGHFIGVTDSTPTANHPGFSGRTEAEFCLMLTADAVDGDTFDFYLGAFWVNNPPSSFHPCTSYTQIPRVTCKRNVVMIQ